MCREKQQLYYLFLLLVHPLVISCIYPHILFNCPGPDDLMALGASLNFDFFHNIIQGDRRLDRLPALLFSYTFYKTFPPLLAHYLLYYTSFCLTTFLVFKVMKLIMSEKSAILCAILFGTNFWVLPLFGNVWITRHIILCIFLAFIFVLRSSKDVKNKLFPMLSGFFCGCAFFSHFAVLPFLYEVPLFFLVSIIVSNAFSIRTFFNFLLCFFYGFLSCLVLFGLVNCILFKGPFLFFINQYAISQTDYSAYLRGFDTVYATASNSLVVFAFMASVFSLLRKGPIDTTKSSIAIWFISSCLLYALFYYIGTFSPTKPLFSFVLWLYYYCRWIIPFCSIAIFASLVPYNVRWKSWHFLLFYAFAVLTITPLGLKIVPYLTFHLKITPDTTSLSLLGILIAMIASYRLTKFNTAIAAALALFSNMLVFSSSSEATATGYVDSAYYARLFNGNSFLQRLNIKAPFYSWLGKNRMEYGVWYEYKSFCKLWLLESYYVDNFPTFGTDKESKFDDKIFSIGNNILIIDENQDGQAVEHANASLLKYDRRLIPIRSTTIGDGKYKYSMIFCRVTTAM